LSYRTGSVSILGWVSRSHEEWVGFDGDDRGAIVIETGSHPFVELGR
jgi:hypothetical protein